MLFASIIVAMILSFGGVNFAQAETDDRNPRDKTLERMQENEIHKSIVKNVVELAKEKDSLKEELETGINPDEKKEINGRINEIKYEIDKIDRVNHKNNIPQEQLHKLIRHQNAFKWRLLNSHLVEFVTSIGIDITSKEIQVGLDQNSVNPDNIDSIVSDLEQMMPKDAPWHVVYSDRSRPQSCNQNECNPIMGGNRIHVPDTIVYCTYGFQATKGTVTGWITAGHCVDGLAGSVIQDYTRDPIGMVSIEKAYRGTHCDCAWIIADPSLMDNKIFGAGIHTITDITSASQQQNDMILVSGGIGGVHGGMVTSINVTLLDFGYYVNDTVRSTVFIEEGDSGGPVVSFFDQSNLYGILIHRNLFGTYHMPIDQIISEMGITLVLG